MKPTHILSLFMIVFMLQACHYRKPSKERFESTTGIPLPDAITVIEDRFENHGPDYLLFYKISFNKEDCSAFLQAVSTSGNWKNNGSRWVFQETIDGTIYDIVFFSESCEVSYMEQLI